MPNPEQVSPYDSSQPREAWKAAVALGVTEKSLADYVKDVLQNPPPYKGSGQHLGKVEKARSFSTSRVRNQKRV